MYQIIEQANNRIEIALTDNLTRDEFIQVVHNLESLISTYGNISILFDATSLELYEFKIVLDEFEFYKSYKNKIDRIAIISQSELHNFFLSIFEKFTEIEIKTFIPAENKEARKWVFPSRLP